VLADWLAAREPDWRARIATVSLDPFRGYATALDIQLPHATRVLDPFHVVKLGLSCLDEGFGDNCFEILIRALVLLCLLSPLSFSRRREGTRVVMTS
jgi:hypothetical protein